MLFILHKEGVSLFSPCARGAGIFSKVDGCSHKKNCYAHFVGRMVLPMDLVCAVWVPLCLK